VELKILTAFCVPRWGADLEAGLWPVFEQVQSRAGRGGGLWSDSVYGRSRTPRHPSFVLFHQPARRRLETGEGQERASGRVLSCNSHVVYQFEEILLAQNYISTEIEVKVSHSCGEFQTVSWHEICPQLLFISAS
jgi:hypothetical protein